MSKPSSSQNVCSGNWPGVVTVVLFALLIVTGHASLLSIQAAGQAGAVEDLRIEVTLDEYSFSPNPLRIPTGRPVTLVIRNVGKVPHEFMAGREVEGDDFKQDLFGSLHVNIERAATTDRGAGHNEHAEEPSHTEQAEHAGAEHPHGTMVENQPGETFLMSFTLPESRRGEWTSACFLPGHYEAGMHGTVIVE